MITTLAFVRDAFHLEHRRCGALVLPDVPTMGTRVDLPGEGVEEALTVVGVTLRAISDGPGIRPPSVDVVLHWEPLATVEAARSAGWRDQTPPGT